MWLAASLVFLSAFTLFSLEFYAAASLLPVYGGSSHVWTACMVWYLFVVWAGYLASRWITPSRSLLLLGIGLAGVMFMQVAGFPRDYGPGDIVNLWLNLTVHAGVPFFLLSCTTPVLQRWIESNRGTHAYYLFAFSNGGSLVAVLGFPFVVQGALTIDGQRTTLGAFAAAVFLGVYLFGRRTGVAQGRAGPGRMQWRWILLNAGSTAWMLAVTQFVSSEVTSHPLLWAVTLALYLAAFVVAFRRRGAGSAAGIVVPAGVAAVCLVAAHSTGQSGIALAAHLALLWTGCLLANRMLARTADRDPSSSYWFYASVGLGGVLGGLVMTFVPVGLGDFVPYSEFDYLVAGWLLAMGLLWQRPMTTRAAVTVGLAALLAARVVLQPETTIHAERNFHGLSRVTETETHRFLYSGVTFHGVLDRARPGVPLAYYHHASPAGEILLEGGATNVLSIGLGVGALLTYVKGDERWTVIELDPAVIRIAGKYFPHVNHAGDRVTILEGDGRRVLRGLDERYDLIIVDAFSSDSIPTHLLTEEAMALYFDHLAPDGELLFHLSSRYVNLAPVFRGHAATFGRQAWGKAGGAGRDLGAFPSTWFLVGRERVGWTRLAGRDVVPWTDQRAPLLPLMSRETGLAVR